MITRWKWSSNGRLPISLKLTAFVSYFPVQQAFYESTNGTYGADADKLLYNGAFRISDWVHSASLTMLKNEQYWNRDSIALNKLDFAYNGRHPCEAEFIRRQ